MRIDAQSVRKGRTDEEKLRRHLYGDIGARHKARFAYPASDGIGNCITTVPNKDDLIVEYDEY